MSAHDAAVLARIREDFSKNFVVEASAGSGKTTALVGRLTYLVIEGGVPLPRIAALTFTEKAATELLHRLRAALVQKRSVAGEPGARAARALTALDEATVCTLHAFATELLRAHPFAAGLDPTFRVLDEDGARALWDRTFAAWFAEVGTAAPGVARLFRRKGREGGDRRGPLAILAQAGWSLAQSRDFQAPWEAPARDRAADLRALIDSFAPLRDILAGAAQPDAFLAQSLATLAEAMDRVEELAPYDLDGCEEELRAVLRGKKANQLRWVGGPRTFATVSGAPVSKDDVLAAREAFRARAQAFTAAAEGELAALLREDLRPVVDRYVQALRASGAVDFLELLLAARRLLRADPSARRALAARWDAFLVDEFQDTDPVQAELLLLLAAEPAAPTTDDEPFSLPLVPGRLFVVGDPKQSIYRFRRADPVLYTRFCERVVAAGGERLVLSATHRFRPSLASFLDGAFGPLFGGSYTDLAPARAELPGPLPPVVALPAPAPFSTLSGRPSQWAFERSFPDAIAAYVEWLTRSSGLKVPDRRRGGLVPIEPRHICLLFKRLVSFGEDVTEPYVSALDRRGILHAAAGARGFFGREEVRQLLALLAAVEDPIDAYGLYAALRGPLVAFGDDALFVAHSERPLDARAREAYLAPPQEARSFATVDDALHTLVSLHHARNSRPFAATVEALLEALAARVTLAFRPAAEQALANVERLLGLARRAADRPDFAAFLAFLGELSARGGTEDGRVAEEGADGVAILSVHRAKGLEFPVVILCDPTAPLTFEDPSFAPLPADDPAEAAWLQPLAGMVPYGLYQRREELLAGDAAEALRLLYVAATRARDHLVIPVGPDGAVPGWTSPLEAGLLPAASRRGIVEPYLGPGGPFGEDPFVTAPPAGKGGPSLPLLRPGVVRAGRNLVDVVVWDPGALPIARDGELRAAGVRRPELLKEAPGTFADPAAATDARRAAALAKVAAAPGALLPATTLAKGGPAARPGAREKEVEVLLLRARAATVRGPRVGNLVHQILQHQRGFLADDPALAPLAAAVAGPLGASQEEQEAAVRRVRDALEHPLFAEVREALARGAVRREATVLLPAPPDGPRGYGTVDLAFHDAGGRWVVVDYKTDAEPASEERLASYRAQLAIYADAFASANGSAPAPAVRAVLAFL